MADGVGMAWMARGLMADGVEVTGTTRGQGMADGVEVAATTRGQAMADGVEVTGMARGPRDGDEDADTRRRGCDEGRGEKIGSDGRAGAGAGRPADTLPKRGRRARGIGGGISTSRLVATYHLVCPVQAGCGRRMRRTRSYWYASL